MKNFNLLDYPRFIEAYKNDNAISWCVSLRNAGYDSAIQCNWSNTNSLSMFAMKDVQYTWFVLRWS